MGIIIVILVVLCTLFATDKITINNHSNQDKINNKTNDNNQSKEEENTNSYTINYKEETYSTKNKEGI